MSTRLTSADRFQSSSVYKDIQSSFFADRLCDLAKLTSIFAERDSYSGRVFTGEWQDFLKALDSSLKKEKVSSN
jgi:hypothetical protein